MHRNTSLLVVLIAGMFLLGGDCLGLHHEPIDAEHETIAMPMYIGKGYNIFRGNPFSDSHDPGFRSNCLQFSGSNTTTDGKYTIPSDIESTVLKSFYSTISDSFHTGVKSYQYDLSTKASSSGGVDIGEAAASFSLSVGFQMMKNATTSKQHIVSKAYSENQFYKLVINHYKEKKVTPEFARGAVASYTTNNWLKFIDEFGTHYTKEVIMGGRATQYIEYTRTSVALLESLGITVKTAAEARIKVFSASSSKEIETSKKNS